MPAWQTQEATEDCCVSPFVVLPAGQLVLVEPPAQTVSMGQAVQKKRMNDFSRKRQVRSNLVNSRVHAPVPAAPTNPATHEQDVAEVAAQLKHSAVNADFCLERCEHVTCWCGWRRSYSA